MAVQASGANMPVVLLKDGASQTIKNAKALAVALNDFRLQGFG